MPSGIMGGVFGNYMDLSENEKNLYGSIEAACFLVGKKP